MKELGEQMTIELYKADGTPIKNLEDALTYIEYYLFNECHGTDEDPVWTAIKEMCRLGEQSWIESQPRDEYLILVNGKEVVTDKRELTYQDIVEFAYGSGPHALILYSVTWSHSGKGGSGILAPDSAPIRTNDYLRFSAYNTSNA